MKKLTISSAFLLFAVFVISCKKQTELVTRPFTGTTVTTAPPDTTTIVSDWFSLSFNEVADIDMGEVYLQGREPFSNYVPYDRNIHVELAYVFMPGQQGPVINPLPMQLDLSPAAPNQLYGFSFWLDNSGFFVSIQNLTDVTSAPDQTTIQDFKYRYLIIPRQVYHSLGIDWDDYNAVATALDL